MKDNLFGIGVVAVLVVASVILADPMHWFMPTMLQVLALSAIVVAFAAFAVFLVRECARDEREAALRATSGRIGFLVGAGVLVAAIAVQGYLDMLDPWLVYALAAMVCGKVAARVYAEW